MDIDALCSELGCATVAALARRLGVSNSYLHDLKAGRRGMTFRFAASVDRERGSNQLVETLARDRGAKALAA